VAKLRSTHIETRNTYNILVRMHQENRSVRLRHIYDDNVKSVAYFDGCGTPAHPRLVS